MEQNLGFISTLFLPLVELHLSSSSDLIVLHAFKHVFFILSKFSMVLFAFVWFVCFLWFGLI